ncbi:hypothetical protein EON65_25465 [archaeon]|nr:MAG: hypothetical protein EON65_25465 [archaeon]
MGVLHAFLLHHSSLPTHRHHIDLICSVALFEADVSISTFKHGARSNSPTCPKYVTCLYEHTVCQHSLLQHYMPQKQLAALPQDNLSWYKYGLLSSLHMHVGCLSDLGLGGIGAMVEQAKGVLGAFQICILPDHKSDTQYTCKNLLECDLLMSTDILDRFTIAAKQEAYVDVHKYANHFAIYFEEQYHTYSDKTAYWQAICKSIKTLDHNILTHWRHSLDERHGGVRSGSSMEGVQLTILAKTKMGVIKDTIHRLHSIADYPSHNDIVLNNLMQLYENVYTSMHGMFAHHQHTHLYKMTQDSDKEEISKMLFTEHCSITVQEVRLMADILDHIQAQYLAPFKSMLNTYPPQHDIHVTVNKLYGHVNMVVQYIVLFMMERFTTMYFHSMVGLLQHVRSALLLCNGVTGVEVIDVITCVVHSLYEQLPNPWGVFIHGELQVQVIHALLDIHATAQDISLQRQSRHLITHFMKLQSDFAPVVLVINLGRRPDR